MRQAEDEKPDYYAVDWCGDCRERAFKLLAEVRRLQYRDDRNMEMAQHRWALIDRCNALEKEIKRLKELYKDPT